MQSERKFLRHPSNISIEYKVEDVVDNDSRDHLTNISLGGLAFVATHPVEKDSTIDIIIPIVKPVFHFIGIVRWCKSIKDLFEVGVEFINTNDKFNTRMIEQVCQIESYKQEVLEKTGRVLTSEEAAMEWIGKYAAQYPKIDEIK